MPRVLVFANGLLPSLDAARALVQPDDVLIGADGGTRHILALGLRPSLVVGDLDSLEPEIVNQLKAEGVDVRRYPQDKNETDLELALRHARERGPSGIVVVGALGARLDQTIGNLALLADPSFDGLDVRADDGAEEAFFCRDRAGVRGQGGEVVSLIPWHGDVTGVTTEGLRWPLRGETLSAYKTRGISNELTGESGSVRIDSGVLLVVHRRLL